jgi:predicted glycosyltransferase
MSSVAFETGVSAVPASASIGGPGTRARVVLYSHDTLGYGHLRRNLLIAGALRQCQAQPDILMIAGMREAGAFALPPGVDCVSLPAYAKGSDGDYRPRDLGGGLDTLRALRASTIRAAVEAFAPDLMIVDNVPRGALFELDPTLKALRKSGKTRLVLGLRDIIDEPAQMRRQWLRQRNFEALREFYSDIWIYGDPRLYDTVREYGLGGDLAAMVRYTGYLDQSARLASPAAVPARDALLGDDARPYVLCTVGGGRDGIALCKAFAAAPLPLNHRGILVTGAQMSESARRAVHAAAAGRDDLTIVDFVREPIALTAGAAAVVAMGGYNTATEVLSLGRPSLIVPRVRPRAEQLIRAEQLAARGLADMMHPNDLTPAALFHWLTGGARRSGARRSPIDVGGLDRIRDLADTMIERPALRRAG